jgi:hypothetical protein
MPRLIDHYFEWDMLGGNPDLLTDRYHKTWKTWKQQTEQALVSHSEILDNLQAGIPKDWPDGATLQRFTSNEKSLRETSESLRTNYDTATQELALQGESALRQGMASTGRTQEEEFQDALRLLKGVLETPIGSRNYVVWFQTGWLQWRAGLITESAESFYQAVRLGSNASTTSGTRYLLLALLHLAFLEAQQQHFAEATQYLQRATQLAPDISEILVESARLAVLQGNPSKAPEYLRPAMLQDLSLLYGYFGDIDFATHIPVVLVRLIQDNAVNNREESQQAMQRYRNAHKSVLDAYSQLELPVLSEEFSPVFLDDPELQGIFGAAALRQKAHSKTEELKTASQKVLQEEINKSKELIDRLQKQLSRFEADRVHWLREKERAELTAREGNFTLDRYSFKNPLTPRKNQFKDQILQMHESSISHLRQAEEQVSIMKPDLEAKLDVQNARIQRIEEMMAWLHLEFNRNL